MKKLTFHEQEEERSDMADRVATLVDNFAADVADERGISIEDAKKIAWSGVGLAMKERRMRERERQDEIRRGKIADARREVH